MSVRIWRCSQALLESLDGQAPAAHIQEPSTTNGGMTCRGDAGARQATMQEARQQRVVPECDGQSLLYCYPQTADEVPIAEGQRQCAGA